MANIYKGTLGLIGNTPLVEVVNVEKELGLEAKILVKLEYFNPAGSVKDRIAKAMIEYRTCIHRSSQRIQNHSYHAGNHERGEKKHPESLRR